MQPANGNRLRPLGRVRVSRRASPSAAWQALMLGLALAASAAVFAILLQVAGADFWTGFSALAKGAFGSRRAILETGVKATPLIFTGLATAIAFRAKVWNIGAEGQLFAGAMAGYWVTTVAGGLPAALLVPLVVLAGCIGGGAYGGLAGVLKTRFKVDEIISTVMLNYIILFALSLLLLNGPWSEPGSVYQQTPRLAENSWLPKLFDRSRLHLGFVIAIAVAAGAHFILRRTTLGYDIRAFGANPVAAMFKGVDPGRTAIVVLVLGGAVAGLAGVGEVFGVLHRLRADISFGLGYTGIIIAILGRLNPFGIVLAALFFGALVNGAVPMQIATGVPTALVYVVEAVVLIFVLTAQALGSFEIRLEPRRG